jgi:hypothetical protein
MTKKQILKRLEEMGLLVDTISFHCVYNEDKDECEDDYDVEFGDCEISGEIGNLVSCTALGTDGKVYNFQALDSLVGGNLGSLAGAF